jgi:hypothetical protein
MKSRARRKLVTGNGSTGRALYNLLDEIVIRRTRQFIRKAYPDATINGKKVHFPKRKLVTVRYDLEGTYAGIYERIVRTIEHLKLAPYDLESYKANPDGAVIYDVGTITHRQAGLSSPVRFAETTLTYEKLQTALPTSQLAERLACVASSRRPSTLAASL